MTDESDEAKIKAWEDLDESTNAKNKAWEVWKKISGASDAKEAQRLFLDYKRLMVGGSR